jgi:hypothetical protein
VAWKPCVTLVVAFVLAGCSGAAGAEESEEEDGFRELELEATGTTGVVRGLVVDDRIVPVAGAEVALRASDATHTRTTDGEGRFGFDDLQPGTYFLAVTSPQHQAVQTTVDVEAGVDDPAIVKILMTRLFSQEPFTVQLKFEGFVACGYSIAITAPCITDYTQVLPPCGGGCVPPLRTAQGDARDYTTSVDAGWQQIVIEMVFEPSSTASSDRMGFVVSHNNRTGATHSFGEGSGESPVRWQADVGVQAPGAASQEPVLIPPEGWHDLLVFANIRAPSSGAGAVTINQDFTIYQHTFYHGLIPEGWSFVAGDEPPF